MLLENDLCSIICCQDVGNHNKYTCEIYTERKIYDVNSYRSLEILYSAIPLLEKIKKDMNYDKVTFINDRGDELITVTKDDCYGADNMHKKTIILSVELKQIVREIKKLLL